MVTQASAAIPVMPLYISMAFKLMKEQGIHEGCIEQIQRLFTTQLYSGNTLELDEKTESVWMTGNCAIAFKTHAGNSGQKLLVIMSLISLIMQATKEFLRLFGFGLDAVDYDAPTNTCR